MFHVRFVLVFALGLAAAPAHAEDENAGVSADDRVAIETTISAQMDAFRRDDGEAAFAFAAPGIRARFGDAETFMTMVRSGYRPV